MESKEIDKRLVTAMHEFAREEGNLPNNLYLGDSEIRQLDVFMDSQSHCMVMDYKNPVRRRTFNGAEIYRVDAATHLACST